MTPHDAREEARHAKSDQDAALTEVGSALMAQPLDVPRYGNKHFCIRTLQGGEIDLWANRLDDYGRCADRVGDATPARPEGGRADLLHARTGSMDSSFLC